MAGTPASTSSFTTKFISLVTDRWVRENPSRLSVEADTAVDGNCWASRAVRNVSGAGSDEGSDAAAAAAAGDEDDAIDAGRALLE